jgi:hypothetical protein
MTSRTKSADLRERAAAREVERLRDEAAGLLQQAAACSNPDQRDALTRAALVSIGRARRLLDDGEPPSPGTRLH